MTLNIANEFLFPKNLTEAAEIQRCLSQKVSSIDQFSEIKNVVGIDVSNNLS